MIKATWNIDPQKLIKNIIKNVEAGAPKIVDAVSKEIEVNARRNFNRAINDISGENPYVVVSRSLNGKSATITCIGEQVLFAEFGAGSLNAYKEITTTINDYSRQSSKGNSFVVKGYDRTIVYSATGFKNGGMTEYMPRPSGIVPLGKYGKGHGKDDYWFYYSVNGRLANREVLWRMSNLNGMYVIKTEGTPPIRALYRARNTAINKLQSGRLKIK